MIAVAAPAVPPEIVEAARALVGDGIRAVGLGAAGGNSRVFKVETERGPVALKFYPRRAGETRNRQDTEWRTLGLLRARGIATVPRRLARDAAGLFMTMEWIDGTPVSVPTEADIDKACQFVADVFRLSDLPEAADFPPASEACVSASEIVRQIAARLGAFIPHPDLDRFLGQRFRPAFDQALAALGGRDLETELPLENRRLIPADFGFHNAYRTAGGGLRFFDFEYFGWDDPVKLTADLMLHPGVPLSMEARAQVARQMTEIRRADTGFAERLKRDYPLYRLRWVLIVLNPLRRDRAVAVPEAERTNVFARQIAQAEAMLASD